MKKSLLGTCGAIGLAFSLPQRAVAQQPIPGVFLDLSCHLTGGGRGPSHAACAASCVKHGGPVGFHSTANNLIYVVLRKAGINANDLVARYIGESSEVEIQGEVSEQNGISYVVLASAKRRK